MQRRRGSVRGTTARVSNARTCATTRLVPGCWGISRSIGWGVVRPPQKGDRRISLCYHRKLNPTAQIIVLDAGGQYCHLIARKVRDLGVYAEVRASETPAAELGSAKGLII